MDSIAQQIRMEITNRHLQGPKLAPSDIMRLIKSNTGFVLRKEFPAFSKTQNMWTRSYFVSTADNVSSDTIQQYIETQKTRS